MNTGSTGVSRDAGLLFIRELGNPTFESLMLQDQ